ncbi:MAG TPA: sigma-54 dependent transcriptional regulator [Chitinophagaceae bacterium]|nr:sigma-54 dependent transcriptional regulator [Chitinophagaceae bacterium]
MPKKILIIDDDVDMGTLLKRFLNKQGYEVEATINGNKGLAKFNEEHFDIVLCDFRLGDKDGREILQKIKEVKPSTAVIIITGYSDLKTAVDVIKMGAFDYITKPLIPDEVINVIERAIKEPEGGFARSEKLPKNKKSFTTPGNTERYLTGKDGETAKVYSQIDIVAGTNYSIIIYGESGTGKEVIAKTIHERSNRRDKPFIAMDCGTLSKELAGSELFGHVKGSFTGAITDKEGHFELANGGTLFLDEVANLSLDIQAALLRVIQERKFKRVGGTKEMNVDVRIIVASNENLQEAYKKGRFREDLYHRFNEFSINLPPLRERKIDIPLFADFFLEKTNEELGKNIEGYEDDVLQMFLNYEWPGNLREFRNVVRRSVLLTPSGKINSQVLPWEITNADIHVRSNNYEVPEEAKDTPVKKEIDLKDAAARAEYETIMSVLKEVNFNKTKAAEILKIDRKTLYNKIKIFQSL